VGPSSSGAPRRAARAWSAASPSTPRSPA
jgi:hypothetical protein